MDEHRFDTWPQPRQHNQDKSNSYSDAEETHAAKNVRPSWWVPRDSCSIVLDKGKEICDVSLGHETKRSTQWLVVTIGGWSGVYLLYKTPRRVRWKIFERIRSQFSSRLRSKCQENAQNRNKAKNFIGYIAPVANLPSFQQPTDAMSWCASRHMSKAGQCHRNGQKKEDIAWCFVKCVSGCNVTVLRW